MGVQHQCHEAVVSRGNDYTLSALFVTWLSKISQCYSAWKIVVNSKLVFVQRWRNLLSFLTSRFTV
jgi:hypothetical protein